MSNALRKNKRDAYLDLAESFSFWSLYSRGWTDERHASSMSIVLFRCWRDPHLRLLLTDGQPAYDPIDKEVFVQFIGWMMNTQMIFSPSLTKEKMATFISRSMPLMQEYSVERITQKLDTKLSEFHSNRLRLIYYLNMGQMP